MNLLGSIYGSVVRGKNALYGRGMLKPRRLAGPVVSVGNISVGGAGKTPFVILLGELLKARGVAFDVLTRGYGRDSQGVRLVDTSGTPEEFGDEPLLIARHLGVPVVVGESRYEAGKFAEEKFGAQVHLLDDGFQHRSLARNFDIVLLSQPDFTDKLLPSGRLREPLAALERADVMVVEEGTTSGKQALPKKPVWRIKRELVLAEVPKRVVAFCGIACPERFFEQLRVAGVVAAAEIAYRDHYRYTAKDVEKLLQMKIDKNCAGFVTTEKDLINLGPQAKVLQPIVTGKVKMELVDPEKAMKLLFLKIRDAGAA